MGSQLNKVNTSQHNKAMNYPKKPEVGVQDKERAKERHSPTPQERKLVDNFFAERKNETPAPKMNVEKGENDTVFIRDRHKDATVAYALLANALGTPDADFISGMISQLASATTGKSEDK